MPHESRPILDYSLPAPAIPRRPWLPLVFLSLAFLVWYRPRLTPTFFPDGLDWTALVFLAAGAFVMARCSSLPALAFAGYGAAAVVLFLCANFDDNSFRSNTNVRDILLPWGAMVTGGALVGRCIASAGRMTAT